LPGTAAAAREAGLPPPFGAGKRRSDPRPGYHCTAGPTAGPDAPPPPRRTRRPGSCRRTSEPSPR